MSVVVIGLAALYLLLLIFVAWQRPRRDASGNWLVVYLGYSAMMLLLYSLLLNPAIVMPEPLTRQLLALTGAALSVGLLTVLSVVYLGSSRRLLVPITLATLLWAAAVAVSRLSLAAPLTGQALLANILLGTLPTLTIEVAVFGWVVFMLLLLALTWRAYLTQQLPLYANRVLFWTMVIPLLMVGTALASWLLVPWNAIGYGLHLLGTLGAVYAVTSDRVVDLRETLRWVLGHALLVVVAAGVVFGAVLVSFLPPLSLLDLSGLERRVVQAIIALLAGALILLLLHVLEWAGQKLGTSSGPDAATAVQQYSERISRVIDLRELAETALRSLADLLGTRSGYLVLATRDADRVLLDRLSPGSGTPIVRGVLSASSPLHKHLAVDKKPVLQYELEYHRKFAGISEVERRFFERMAMDLYVPIAADGQLIGLLAVGPKVSDAPYHEREIDLLAALANQTVTALENARLVNDLRDLNQRISALNEDLSTTNERLQRLDAVKTDFLTIAGHELRTPLTQVQGYAELLLDMSEGRQLDVEEVEHITRHLTGASRRMRDVITALLDVTELDIETMDLAFSEVRLSELAEAAAQPYRTALKQRGQTLVIDLADTPPIQADAGRLTQALQNLITNAIKFTPDGGEITIQRVAGPMGEHDGDGAGDSVHLHITDSGIGIDTEHQSLIFEKFFRVGPVDLHSSGVTKFKGGGPGLGLPIAKTIIEAHGGRIWVESPGHDEKTNPGSTFHIVLPVKPPVMAATERLQVIQAAKEDTLVGHGAAHLPDSDARPSPHPDLPASGAPN